MNEESTVELPSGVKLRRSSILTTLGGWLSGRKRAMSAVTIRHTIFIHPDRLLTDRLLRHELVHVKQWESHPWSFPLRYTWFHLRHGYNGNPFEDEARLAESQKEH